MSDDIKESLSDFGSCISEYSSGDEEKDGNVRETDLDKGDFILKDKRRSKKSKRKASRTPPKEFFLKKPNIVLSPSNQNQ